MYDNVDVDYTQEDLIEEPVEKNVKNKDLIKEKEEINKLGDEAVQGIHKADGVKIWVILDTFLTIFVLMFVIVIFMTQMMTPVV